MALEWETARQAIALASPQTASYSSPQSAAGASTGFNPSVWSDWLLLAVVVVFSTWVLRTSARWRREWQQSPHRGRGIH